MKPIKGEVQRDPRIGEVVIVKDDDLTRASWKLARITGLIKSNIDDIPRAANLITSCGRHFKRPLRLLYPLEGADLNNDGNNESESTSSDNQENNAPNVKPPRLAAVVAREKIRRNAKVSVDGSVDNVSIN